MMNDSELLRIATQELAVLNAMIARAEQARAQALSQYIELNPKFQEYWYATDANGYILTKQDAPFVCEGMFLIGNDVQGSPANAPGGNFAFSVSVEDLGPSHQATEGYAPVVNRNTDTRIYPVITVPVELFRPIYRQGDRIIPTPANVDFWFQLAAEWVIPKGDTLRFLFTPNQTNATPPVATTYTPPNIVLAGYKVFP